MQHYAVRTATSLVLLAASMTALAQWQEGDFSGELNWRGAVTQNRNPWAWAQGTLDDIGALTQTRMQAEGREVVWHDLLKQTPLLVGKIQQLMPMGRAGVSPVIQLGQDNREFSLVWKGAGIAEVTLPVTDKEAGSNALGTLTFQLRVAGILAATTGVTRRGYGLVATDAQDGNGVPPSTSGLAYDASVAVLQAMAGSDAPTWLSSRLADGGSIALNALHNGQNQAVGAMYGAEILPGTGSLRFPAGKVPKQWRVSLPIRITYR
ncbi:hypothetical protein A3218_19960 [Pseudomonas chlororaphis]|uniref:F4 family fimbrial subunit n=1 Tax=Pseudomonas chlororaphis TaxID=587753 RepID=UPI000789FA19|nr:hypothetical protein [Pseudomonas chlororaphis]AMS16481.1 hypothetical protein A3218_19960 [Pseudomonas chlororaphis]